MKEFFEEKGYKAEIALRLRKIVRKENSFLLGFTEIIANNFDYIFRYLYAMAFLFLMSGQFIVQLKGLMGFSFLAAIIVLSVIFLTALFISIVQYRMKTSNLPFSKAILFYVKLKCFKSKHVLDNYD